MPLRDHTMIKPAVTSKDLLQQINDLEHRLEAAARRERTLGAAVSKWQDLFDAIAAAICVLDQDQRIVQCNQAMRELLCLPEDRIIGRHCWELIHGTGQPLPDCPCPLVRKNLRRQTATLEHDQRWYEVAVDPRFDDQGRLISYIHVMSDITPTVLKEKALQDAHHTLLTVLDSIDAFIYAADLETYAILFMNQRLREFFKDDLLTQPCWRAFHHREGPCDHCRSEQMLDDQGRPRDVCVWEDMNHAQTRWYLHHDRAVKWADGRYVRLHVATDISAVKTLEQERIQNEARLRQAQKMEAIGTLAGGIAHDFNNILSAILGYSDLALDDANRGQANPAYISQILHAGQRARDLVQQILTFSRQTETEAKPIQIQPIIKEALKLLRASLPATIQISIHIESDAVVRADPVQIHQVVMNLCTNASHAMRQKGGQLKVSISEEELTAEFTDHYPDMLPERYLKLQVSDTGHGMDPAIMDKIFDPYFTTRKKEEGTGMGLAVVQGIVRSFKGTVTVNSRKGEGALFTIYLPIVQQTDMIRAVAQETVPIGHERILFVDDEQPLVALGKELLERLGYRVTVCTDSTEALDLFERRPTDFDLIITDLTMPHMTGEALAEKIMAIRPGMPVMICTGYSQNITQEMIARLGIRALIMKPLVRQTLAMAIRTVLDGGTIYI